MAIANETSFSETVQSHYCAPPDAAGPWLRWGQRSEPKTHGWKLHVSSTPRQAGDLLRTIAPLLAEDRVRFKCARDEETLTLLNEGAYGPTQVGKFITIYPRCDAHARELAQRLRERTNAFSGPVVPTDMRLGNIVYARFGAIDPVFERDRLGQVRERQTGQTDGSYTVPFVVPEGVDNPFEGLERPTPEGSGLLGPGYLLLEPIYTSAKGSVLRGLDLRTQSAVQEVIVKEGRRHCLEDEHGRDMRDRLQHQRELLDLLQGKIRVPKPGPYFEAFDNGFLAMQSVSGVPLLAAFDQRWGEMSSGDRRRLFGVLADVARQLQVMHDHGLAHRDVTPRNVLVDADDQAWLIDLELAAPVDGSIAPFTLGTRGFMSPQQESRAPASFADDVFGLAATAVFATTQTDPTLLHYGFAGGLAERIRVASLGLDGPLLRCLCEALCSDPAQRPSLHVLEAMLRGGAHGDATAARDDDVASPLDFVDCARRAAGGLLHVARRHPDSGLWVSYPLDSKTPVATPELYRSFNRGVAGPVYALSKLVEQGVLPPSSGVRNEVCRAVDWLLRHEPTRDDQLPGLHFGEAGVALSIATSVAAGLVDDGPWLATYLEEVLTSPPDWPDLTHGAAGQALAALSCAQTLERPSLLELARPYLDYLVRTQQADGGWVWPEGVVGMDGTSWTGFAHGVAGCAHALCRVGAASNDARAIEAGVRGARWVWEARLSQQDAPRWAMSSEDPAQWHWWCHGGPGVALAFLSAYEATSDDTWAERARRCLADIPARPPIANLSICHGVTGLAEILLEGARVLDERTLADQAKQLASTLWAMRRDDRADCASWLVEGTAFPTADLMVGNAGVAHLFGRLASNNAFPMAGV